MSETAENKEGMVLAGDIGGTKTRLAAFALKKGLREPLAEAVFESRDYPDFETIVREFISGNEIKAGFASFGVAGPIVDGQAKITNLPWVIDETSLALSFDFHSVRILNDALALAYAVPFLGRSELEVLNRGHPRPDGTIAVVAPGTGLGQAYLVREDAGFRGYASEGGHADFAPANDLEIGLLSHLMKRFGHVSYERVCSEPRITPWECRGNRRQLRFETNWRKREYIIYGKSFVFGGKTRHLRHMQRGVLDRGAIR